MNIAVVSGSNRPKSGSRKTADYIVEALANMGEQSQLFDLHEMNLPLWSQDMWDADSAQVSLWQEYKDKLKEADGLVIIAAEWNGTIPPSLHNFIMHLDRSTVGHKPVLIVGVSAGIGGTYPIAELKSSINKNNRMVLIPDHVIVRHVNHDFDNDDHIVGPRIVESIKQLVLYAKHMGNLRQEMTFDYKQFGNGM